MTYAIIKAVIWSSDKVGYTQAVGRRYKTIKGAQKAWQVMQAKWDLMARRGLIHPSHNGKFSKHYKLVTIQEGQTLREAVNGLGPDIYYYGTAK